MSDALSYMVASLSCKRRDVGGEVPAGELGIITSVSSAVTR